MMAINGSSKILLILVVTLISPLSSVDAFSVQSGRRSLSKTSLHAALSDRRAFLTHVSAAAAVAVTASSPALAEEENLTTKEVGATFAPSLSVTNKDVWVFVAGVIPFAWATVEFWRRIAVGEPFGTGSDSVFIGKDNVPSESRGRRTLDRGAFTVAYILFGIAAGIIGLTIFSILSSSAPPETL